MKKAIAMLLCLAGEMDVCQMAVADAPPAVVKATGTVEPANVVDVVAHVEGRVEKFGTDPQNENKTIDYSSRVKKGMLLVQLESKGYAAAVDKAKADLQLAIANLDLAKSQAGVAEHEVQRQIKRESEKTADAHDVAVAKSALDAAQAKIQTAGATIEQRKADLRLAEVDLDHCTIRSPVDGIILDRRINTRRPTVLGPNELLFLIVDDSKKFQVWADLTEADIGRVAKDQPVRFTVEAFPNKTYTGRVSQIRPNALKRTDVVHFTVVITVDDNDGLLPYLTANVEIAGSESK